MLPTVTFPKARLVGFALSVPGVTPVPDSETVNVGFGASEVIVRVPVALPLEVGAKLTVKLVLCDAVSVSGAFTRLTENPLPLTEICEMDTLVVPVFVIVSDSVPLLPVLTLPKLRLVGFAVRAPGATPVPDTGIVSVGLLAVEVMVRVPLTAPPVPGANETVKFVLWPAFNVRGVVIPLTLKPVPVTPT